MAKGDFLVALLRQAARPTGDSMAEVNIVFLIAHIKYCESNVHNKNDVSQGATITIASKNEVKA